ncbi:MAG: hypothetical protein Q7U25_01040, partial [Sulfuricella sp.]|nr:hypothetical protein [Sulfuricella sp.]
MNPTWKDHLIKAGATLANDHAIHFGNPEKELLAAQSGTILTDLSHRGMIGVNGEDSQTFLQGQTTNDVRLATDRAQYNSLCTPKGRMLASFLLWRDADGYFLQLPGALQAGIQKRLAMYVLRSKVKVRDAGNESVRLGVAGMGAEALLQAAIGALPSDVLGVARHDKGTIIRLGANRFEIVATPEQGPALWEELSRPGACRTYGDRSENSAGRGQILPVLQVNSHSIDQKSGEIWTAQADLQPIHH